MRKCFLVGLAFGKTDEVEVEMGDGDLSEGGILVGVGETDRDKEE
jgi:hypothetical protein